MCSQQVIVVPAMKEDGRRVFYKRPAKAKIPPARAPMMGAAVGIAPPGLVAGVAAPEALAAASMLLTLEAIEEAAEPLAVESSERRLETSEAKEFWALLTTEVIEEMRDWAPEIRELMPGPAADVADASSEPALDVMEAMFEAAAEVPEPKADVRSLGRFVSSLVRDEKAESSGF